MELMAVWIVLGCCVVAYFGALTIIARVSVTPPRVPLFFSPALVGLSQEDVSFDPEPGLALSGWWISAPEPRGVAVLCHGYIMNRCELAPLASALCRQGWSCLAFDFRAHGRSQGKRCSFGLHEAEDVAAAMRLASERAPGLPIVVIGSSMGGVAAALAASNGPRPAALVLDGVYSRLDHAAGGWWEFLAGKWLRAVLAPATPISGLWIGFRPKDVDVREAIAGLSGLSMLFVNGTRDPIVTREAAEANLKAGGPNARISWYEGSSHGEPRFREPDRYVAELTEFLGPVLSADRVPVAQPGP